MALEVNVLESSLDISFGHTLAEMCFATRVNDPKVQDFGEPVDEPLTDRSWSLCSDSSVLLSEVSDPA